MNLNAYILQHQQSSRIFTEKSYWYVFGRIRLVPCFMRCSEAITESLSNVIDEEKRPHYYSRYKIIFLHDQVAAPIKTYSQNTKLQRSSYLSIITCSNRYKDQKFCRFVDILKRGALFQRGIQMLPKAWE